MMQFLLKNSGETVLLEQNASFLIQNENLLSMVEFLIGLNAGNTDDFFSIYDSEKGTYLTSDELDFIDSVLFLDLNNKKNISVLQKQLKKYFQTSLTEEGEKLSAELSEFFKSIVLDFPLPLESQIELKAEDVLKLLNVRFLSEEGTVTERILRYIDISIELRKCRGFFFHHLSDYLSKDDLNSLFYEVKLKNVLLIDLEKEDPGLNFDKKIIIDSDACTIS
jgi:CRISPR type II-A-associated protein Csn2